VSQQVVVIAQGGLERGMLKWSLEIVRQCDMFWMGVTSRSGLDMSTMIARDPKVWMISEEGTCIEHCRGAHQSITESAQMWHRTVPSAIMVSVDVTLSDK
jgi:hypothetical protein